MRTLQFRSPGIAPGNADESAPGGEGRGGGAGAYYTLTSFLYCVICVAISFVNLSMLTKTKYIANTGGLGLNDLE